eukprot:TRINITY_DN10679_c0_g1_i1.p1 TRINITY_DN10679_c0_g1~~TRINITY_DN10679_c0_g1_i1.p1  ORF type:complete len:207 (-),score=42.60 TRINITY_DN10679_c0_g1_i1:838-1458(-)
MEFESQSTLQEPAPLSPNKRIENRSMKKGMRRNLKPSRKALLRGAIYKTSVRRKENVSTANPLSFIDKIIYDCNLAVHQSSDSDSELFEDHSCYIARPENIAHRYYTKGKHKARLLNKTDMDNQIEDLKKKYKGLPRTTNSKRSFNYTGIVPGISNEMLKRLYEAKCADLQLSLSGEQERRFVEFCTKVIQYRRLALKEVILVLIC